MDVVDARINLDGEIMISKEAPVSQRTIPIDLQWMVMACDPESVERETCDELPVKQTTIRLLIRDHIHRIYFRLNFFSVRYKLKLDLLTKCARGNGGVRKSKQIKT